MKRVMVRIAFILTMIFSASVSYAATDVHFTGVLVSDPCSLATDSEDQLVDFGSIPKKDFLNDGVSLPKRFTIILNDCDTTISDMVKLTFLGDEDSSQKGLFSTTGDAKGVAIKLTQEDGSEILPNAAFTAGELNNGSNEFMFQAAVSSGSYDQITFGDFKAVIGFSMEYY